MRNRRSVKLVRLFAVMAVLATQVLVVQPARAATTLLVPSQYPTIQAAIDAAGSGDIVQVAAGTYAGPINLGGKNISVIAVDGPSVTTINGNETSPVVLIGAFPGESPTFAGFRVTGAAGFSSVIVTAGGPAVIRGNIIENNVVCGGAAIEASFSNAIITGNTISGNRPPAGCSPASRQSNIFIGASMSPTVKDNIIVGNQAGWGGGITILHSVNPIVERNIIRGNTANYGGGIAVLETADATIVNNIVTHNTAAILGGGIYWNLFSGNNATLVVNNTIVENTAPTGSAMFVDGFDTNSIVRNNILSGGGPGSVIHCGPSQDQAPPIIEYNNVFMTGTASEYGGNCSSTPGLFTNISGDPGFVDSAHGDYHLAAFSSMIDAGTNTGAPSTDFDGRPRPIDGNGDGLAVTDMGAFESQAEFAPPVMVITQNTTLTANVLKPVVIAADGITLDCVGFAVIGPFQYGTTEAGITISGRRGVTVKNCVVAGWNVGINVTSTTDSQLRNNRVQTNLTAGLVLNNSHGNVLVDNFASNIFDGFLLTSSNNNRLERNTADSDGGFRLDNSNDNVLVDNVARATGPHGISLTASSRNKIQRNRFDNVSGDGLNLSSGSNDNVVQDNTAIGNRSDGFEVNGSSRNTFAGNRADDGLEYGFNVINTSLNNRFTRNGGCHNGITPGGDVTPHNIFSDAFVDRSSTGNVWTQSSFCNTSGQFQAK